MRSKLSIALLWILVFLLGGVAGAVSDYLYRGKKPAAAAPAVPPKPQDIIDGIARELRLDNQQKESLKAIFDQSGQRYRALRQQYRPQWDTIRNDTDEQVRAMLHPDQKALFEDLLKKVYSKPPGPPPSRKNN
ncbi:MAG: hypothetical protein ABSC60_00825 [Acidobacteriota bacterium]